MKIREASVTDIPQLQQIRNAAKENELINTALVTRAHYEDYLMRRGKGWVCEAGKRVLGFAIVDLYANNVWALFVKPGFERQGVGRLLHNTMLDWYFSTTGCSLWLSTSPNTRAERFYRKAGWEEAGKHGADEIKFIMPADKWLAATINKTP